MNAALATHTSEPTRKEPLDNLTAARALEWAEAWWLRLRQLLADPRADHKALGKC